MADKREHVLSLVLVLVAVANCVRGADIDVSIKEEEREDIIVVNVSNYPALFVGVSNANRKSLVFNILDKSSVPASFFKIDASSGVISMATRLDREQVCGSLCSCALEFNVAIEGLAFTNIATVKVTVLDVNDNPPSFPSSQVYLKVSEGAKVGTVLQLSGAQDLDCNSNFVVQRYEMAPKTSAFSISATRSLGVSSFINLRLEQGLDRETTREYNFNVIAVDGGDPALNDTLKVNIQVEDENDNPPMFQQEAYAVEVKEDAPVGSKILQVRATDKDSGVYGTVQYRFSSLRSDVVDRFFTMNSSTGDVTLKAQLEHKTGISEYNLIVEAFDGGTPPFVVQAVVTIKVQNTGNNPPVVRIVTVQTGDTSEVQILESALVDSFVAFVNVEDSDASQNGNVSCSMNSTPEFRLEKLVNKGYKIVLNKTMDREATPAYTLAISCADMGTPPLTTTVTCNIFITDVNDNPPMFDKSDYLVTVDENNGVTQYLLQVTATDADAGTNALIAYSLLEPEAAHYLRVDPQTGIISAAVSLDREVTPELRFTLTATDSGNPPLTATASLTITTGDLNDNAPQFQGLPYIFTVSERTDRGFLVGHILATDADVGRNGEVELFFAGSVSGEVPFTVHPNGSITVSRALDRETDPIYGFTVLARDRGNIPLSNTTHVTVSISDVNDNPPVILFPTNVNHSVVISRQPEAGTVLARIIAYDIDDSNASSLVFSISNGNEDGVFQVDPKSGELSLTGVQRLKNPHVYQLHLRVSDMGVPPLSATTSLLVEVSFQNLSAALGDASNVDGENSHDSYVVIVGVIGGVTLVLSGIIIGAILFVLRSERHRKPPSKHSSARSSCPVFKNDYVTPKAESSPRKNDPQRGNGSPRPPSQEDLSSSSSPPVLLSPKGLPQRPDVQKKVSFSLDQPAAETPQIQTRGLSSPPPPPLPPPPSVHDVAADGCLWKRINGPDDVNSDASGESGTSDSGKGASDDDTHLDISLDKHAGTRSNPTLTSFRASPERIGQYSSATLTVGSYRQGHGHPESNPPGQRSSSKPRCLYSGSYLESRRPQVKAAHPYRRNYGPPYCHPAQASGYAEGLSSHPSGSRHSLDLMDNVVSRLPPRSASSMSYQRQGSSTALDDDVSTTTSGSYTVTPEEFRLEGAMSHDVIV